MQVETTSYRARRGSHSALRTEITWGGPRRCNRARISRLRKKQRWHTSLPSRDRNEHLSRPGRPTRQGTERSTLVATLHVCSTHAGTSNHRVEVHFALDSHDLPHLLACVENLRNDTPQDIRGPRSKG